MPAKPSKYRNVKTVVGDVVFDSRREAEAWMGLVARERAGEIAELQRQVRFPLYCPIMDNGSIGPGSSKVADYIADFTFKERDVLKVLDAKGLRTQMYRLKARWLYFQQGIEIVEV